MNAVDVSPTFPSSKQAWQRVRQAMLERRHDDTSSRAGHAQHIAEHERRRNRVRLASTSPNHDDHGLGCAVLSKKLWLIIVYSLGMKLSFRIPYGCVNFVGHYLLA